MALSFPLGAAAFADWLVSDAGQARIAAFRVRGQQVFFPNAPGDRINCWRRRPSPMSF